MSITHTDSYTSSLENLRGETAERQRERATDQLDALAAKKEEDRQALVAVLIGILLNAYVDDTTNTASTVPFADFKASDLKRVWEALAVHRPCLNTTEEQEKAREVARRYFMPSMAALIEASV